VLEQELAIEEKSNDKSQYKQKAGLVKFCERGPNR